jgi:twitching motility protein PilT
MEKLNAYLQELLSSCSEELRLEPDKNPYLVAASGTRDVAQTPLPGTQISSLVFPLIPADVRLTLPNRDEVEFVHPHNLGKFTFTVQKSSSGFNVTIRPVMGIVDPASNAVAEEAGSVPQYPTQAAPPTDPQPYYSAPQVPAEVPSYEQISYDLESASAGHYTNAAEDVPNSSIPDLLFEESGTAQEYVPPSDDAASQIEIVSVNDPEFQTVFSDASTYEPPGRRDDLTPGEYIAPAPAAEPAMQETFTQQSAYVPPPPPSQEYQPAPAAQPSLPADPSMTGKMEAYFRAMAEMGASDLHMSVSMPPMVRKDGKIRTLAEGDTTLTPDAMERLLMSIMPQRNQEEFAQRNDTDFAYEIAGLARFRCNIFRDRKGMGGVFRVIPSKMTTASQIGLSKAILGLTELSKGLVVVTGPTGSGKSTTLCAMVNEINMTREDHIITIEDPVEFVHENIKCLVNQREIHSHTDSFKDALRAALREDPDIVLVGEMRDLETISIAIETAETGHLVFGTLHTTTAASTVDRIIDQFPADRQQQIRVMLSESLKGVIAQTLLPKKGGGRVAALEVLIVTPVISNLIREGKTFQIPSAMQTGRNHGMVMLNDALYEYVQQGVVEPMDAYIKAVDKTGFETMLTRGGFKLS